MSVCLFCLFVCVCVGGGGAGSLNRGTVSRLASVLGIGARFPRLEGLERREGYSPAGSAAVGTPNLRQQRWFKDLS